MSGRRDGRRLVSHSRSPWIAFGQGRLRGPPLFRPDVFFEIISQWLPFSAGPRSGPAVPPGPMPLEVAGTAADGGCRTGLLGAPSRWGPGGSTLAAALARHRIKNTPDGKVRGGGPGQLKDTRALYARKSSASRQITMKPSAQQLPGGSSSSRCAFTLRFVTLAFDNAPY
jgi:hypothetical protein